ncbi:MAG TPA: hypothetical protein VGL13_06430, partial [Polyangiaceae bacterium]
MTVVRVVTFLGSGWMILPLAAGFFSRAWRRPSGAATALLVLTSAVVASTKAITVRVRPCNAMAWAHALPLDFPTD